MSGFVFDAATGRFARLVAYPESDSDTHPEGGDGTAPFMGSAGRQASPNPIQDTPYEE